MCAFARNRAVPGCRRRGSASCSATTGSRTSTGARLGTPADLRFLFHSGRVAEGAAAFKTHIEATAAVELDALAEQLPNAPRTALLCLEADPAVCHRRVLTDALQERLRDLRVVDL